MGYQDGEPQSDTPDVKIGQICVFTFFVNIRNMLIMMRHVDINNQQFSMINLNIKILS